LPELKLIAYSSVDANDSQSHLAYLLTILHIGFCQTFGFIVRVLIESVTNDSVTVRARSLKSVAQMLEKDAGLLDRTPQVLGLILRCAADVSSMVRDNALALLGKCVQLRPAMESEVLKTILGAASDPALILRKRALKLLQETYHRNSVKLTSGDGDRKLLDEIRGHIANTIFDRVNDEEESLVKMVHEAFEELWLEPYQAMAANEEQRSTSSLKLREQVGLIVHSVQQNQKISDNLEKLFSRAMSTKSKNAAVNSKICKVFVARAFEGIITPGELPGSPNQREIFHTLSIFAHTQPKLFTAEHVQLLTPYIGSLSTTDDLLLFRWVVVILRCVFSRM